MLVTSSKNVSHNLQVKQGTRSFLEKKSENRLVSVLISATNNYFKNHMKRQSWENLIEIDSAKEKIDRH